ncbi:uncharacterized protein LOC109848771 isoform X2 [Asparagus officinalis]|uniref:uncharacterized protein LOC109848771 isoform X2 n=1 Tax=Asparagus officinalis TaxID=4686 RepID=UPI00098E7F52|nr:uncharacterized protein LOC109848771 isoform X2 [Asparagus officinalis]
MKDKTYERKKTTEMQGIRPPNLRLNKTTEFMMRIEKRLFEKPRTKYQTIKKYQSEAEKLKASNFPARKLEIGSWERVAKNDNEIVGKFYFAKKLLIWELLEKDGLKKKIQIQWNNLSSLRAIYMEGKASILQIELEKPPTFYEEQDPQPKKHTFWKEIKDFTNGEASRCRRHTLTFAEGVLEKHYEKLVHSNGLLFLISRGSFPANDSPFFDIIEPEDSPLENQYAHMNPIQESGLMVQPLRLLPQEFPFAHYPSMIENLDPMIPGMHFAAMNEHALNHMSIDPMLPISANNFQPTNSPEMNSGLNVSFPPQTCERRKGCVFTMDNQIQEQPMLAYSTSATNLNSRRVMFDPRTQIWVSNQIPTDNAIPSGLPLNPLKQGIQPNEGIYLSNNGEYNPSDIESAMSTGLYNQNEELVSPTNEDINQMNGQRMLRNHNPVIDFDPFDGLEEDFNFYNHDFDTYG